MRTEKKRLVLKIYDFVMPSARRLREGKYEIRHDDDWLTLDELPLAKLRKLAHSTAGDEPHNPLAGFHDKHLCSHCGTAAEQHKGGTDYAGPVGTCPSTFAWGMMKPFPKFGGDDAAVDKALLRFWGTESTFKPVR